MVLYPGPEYLSSATWLWMSKKHWWIFCNQTKMSIILQDLISDNCYKKKCVIAFLYSYHVFCYFLLFRLIRNSEKWLKKCITKAWLCSKETELMYINIWSSAQRINIKNRSYTQCMWAIISLIYIWIGTIYLRKDSVLIVGLYRCCFRNRIGVNYIVFSIMII